MSTRSLACLAALSVVVGISTGSLAAEPEVRFESGRLWVKTAGAVAAAQVLEAVSKQTGVEIVLAPELAGASLDVEIGGMELERALRRLVAEIPGSGGHTVTYLSSAAGDDRVAHMRIFGLGRSPSGGVPAPEEGDVSAPEESFAEATVVEAPAATRRDLEAQKEQLIESGIPEETAGKFVELVAETLRLQGEPGAVEAFTQTERYREVMREVAEATGKGPPR